MTTKLPKIAENNTFLFNKANYGPNFASYPVSFGLIAYRIISVPKNFLFDTALPKFLQEKVKIQVIFNSSSSPRTLFSLHDISSSAALDINFYFEARDHYGQTTDQLNGRSLIPFKFRITILISPIA